MAYRIYSLNGGNSNRVGAWLERKFVGREVSAGDLGESLGLGSDATHEAILVKLKQFGVNSVLMGEESSLLSTPTPGELVQITRFTHDNGKVI